MKDDMETLRGHVGDYPSVPCAMSLDAEEDGVPWMAPVEVFICRDCLVQKDGYEIAHFTKQRHDQVECPECRDKDKCPGPVRYRLWADEHMPGQVKHRILENPN